VKDEALVYFENKFHSKAKLGVNLDGVQFRKISVADNERLCSKFNDVEILEAVK